MKTSNFTKWATCTAAVFAFTFTSALSSHAAVVTWGAATQITGDSNVITTGALVGAFNVGDGGVPSAIVNGVTFQPFAVNSTGGPVSTATVGNFTLSTTDLFASDNTLYGAAVAPFTSLSAGYQTLLRSATSVSNFAINPGEFKLTINGLSLGQQYRFQWFANLSGPGAQLHLAKDEFGNSVTLNDNTTNVNGGLGQFAVGSFTASAANQVITFDGVGAPNNFAMINGFQLRVVAPVPESASLLFGVGLIPLIAIVELRRKRRSASTAIV